MNRQQSEQRQLIEQARALLKPSPVKLHHVPNWLRQRIMRMIDGPFYGTSGFALLERAVTALDCRAMLDHWGSTRRGDAIAFVSEPYLGTIHLDAARLFADRLKLDLHVSPNSFWYPGETTRLAFTLPEASA